MIDQAAAGQLLSLWRIIHDARDPLVRAAHAAGLNKHRIYKLTGIARTTIDRIIERTPE
jgi:hypothetical protein